MALMTLDPNRKKRNQEEPAQPEPTAPAPIEEKKTDSSIAFNPDKSVTVDGERLSKEQYNAYLAAQGSETAAVKQQSTGVTTADPTVQRLINNLESARLRRKIQEELRAGATLETVKQDLLKESQQVKPTSNLEPFEAIQQQVNTQETLNKERAITAPEDLNRFQAAGVGTMQAANMLIDFGYSSYDKIKSFAGGTPKKVSQSTKLIDDSIRDLEQSVEDVANGLKTASETRQTFEAAASALNILEGSLNFENSINPTFRTDNGLTIAEKVRTAKKELQILRNKLLMAEQQFNLNQAALTYGQ